MPIESYSQVTVSKLGVDFLKKWCYIITMMNEENILKVTIDLPDGWLRTEFVKAMSFAQARRLSWNSLLTDAERAAGASITVELACEKSDS